MGPLFSDWVHSGAPHGPRTADVATQKYTAHTRAHSTGRKLIWIFFKNDFWVDLSEKFEGIWRGAVGLSAVTGFNFDGISFILIPFDSSLNGLSIVYWVGIDWMKRWGGKNFYSRPIFVSSEWQLNGDRSSTGDISNNCARIFMIFYQSIARYLL